MTSSRQPHTKVSREDWIDAALAALVEQPIDQLKILSLANELRVSRSSFYWYFTGRSDLLDVLLGVWERNTESIIGHSQRQAPSVASACLGVFECWADDRLYDPQLDLAVRDWGRRDVEVAARVAESDRTRLDALGTMFARYGFSADESTVRARLLYHSQIGYYAVGTNESIEARLGFLPHYVHAMAGSEATEEELAAFRSFLGNRAVVHTYADG